MGCINAKESKVNSDKNIYENDIDNKNNTDNNSVSSNINHVPATFSLKASESDDIFDINNSKIKKNNYNEINNVSDIYFKLPPISESSLLKRRQQRMLRIEGSVSY